MKHGKVIARINHKWIILTHIYSVDIADDVTDGEVPFILSLVIVLWCAQRYRGGKVVQTKTAYFLDVDQLYFY
jgi:hypothetical protein